MGAAIGQRRVGRGRVRGPRRSRRKWASTAMAQSFGRDPSRPFAALAVLKSWRTRSRSPPSAIPSRGCGLQTDRFQRSSRIRPSVGNGAHVALSGEPDQSGSAVDPRVEGQVGKGDGLGKGLRLEWQVLFQPFADRLGDDRHSLERPPLLRLANGDVRPRCASAPRAGERGDRRLHQEPHSNVAKGRRSGPTRNARQARCPPIRDIPQTWSLSSQPNVGAAAGSRDLPRSREELWPAGYEDVNDAERLRHDPAMRWIVGGKAASGCAASASQMGRFETR